MAMMTFGKQTFFFTATYFFTAQVSEEILPKLEEMVTTNVDIP